MAVTRTAAEDAAVVTEAARQGVTSDVYLQAQSDQQMTSLRSDQLNDWWRDLPLEDADACVTTKQSVYDANQ